MRYKHFKPLVHNFSHSFMGGCNYVDDGFVFEDLINLARSRRGAPVIIQWWPQTTAHDPELSEVRLTQAPIAVVLSKLCCWQSETACRKGSLNNHLLFLS
jgi:hypothetical protein